MKKIIIIILKLIPIISLILSLTLIFSSFNNTIIKNIISISTLLSFFGFIFYFIGKKIIKDNKIIKILGIFDLLSTLAIILFYVIAIFSFGL